MMERMLICIAIIALCGYFGRLKAKKLKLRLQCITEMREILICLQAEMRNQMFTIMESLNRISHNAKIFAPLLKICARKVKQYPAKPFYEIWEEETHIFAKEDPSVNTLNAEELNLLCRTGKSLVNVSIPTQDAYFTMLFEEYAKFKENAKSEADKKTKLYHSLSLLAGFFIAILLI